MSRIAKAVVLHVELILYNWLPGLYLFIEGEKNSEDIEAPMQLAIAFGAIILSLLPVYILTRFLRYGSLPPRFLTPQGQINPLYQEQYSKWLKRQQLFRGIGYVLGVIAIFTLSAHAYYLSLDTKREVCQIWMRVMLFAYILDYAILQLFKGAIYSLWYYTKTG